MYITVLLYFLQNMNVSKTFYMHWLWQIYFTLCLSNVNLEAFLPKYAYNFYIRLILLIIEKVMWWTAWKKRYIKLKQLTILILVRLNIFVSFIQAWLGITSHRHSKGHMATFQLYWWRKISGALLWIISGTNGYLSRTTYVP
jgi:hypothetical protein